MHAFLIALESYIETIQSLFTDAPITALVMLTVAIGVIAKLFWEAVRGNKRRVRPGHGSSGGGPAIFSDADGATHGRTSPLFTGQRDAPDARNWEHSHFMDDDSGFEPSVNINGMPMIPGTGIDVGGNPYGST
jgi:hypothetical protein